MGLLERLSLARTRRQLSTMARDVAVEARHAVWDRTRDQIFEMPLPEARGYVRARATEVVRRHVERLADADPMLSNQRQAMLTAEAHDRVVHAVLCDLLSGSNVARRAA